MKKIRWTSECTCNTKMQTIKQENAQTIVQYTYEHSLNNAKVQQCENWITNLAIPKQKTKIITQEKCRH